MGSNLTNSLNSDDIHNLNLSKQQKSNLEIYLWRSSPQTNQYISRVKIYQNRSKTQQTKFICLSSLEIEQPMIEFEKYVCDFRFLRNKLRIEDLLTVFRAVLKGHQNIYKRFGGTLISEKSSFITYDGQIRVWINPNYYRNNFWQKPRSEYKLRSLSGYETDKLTPRFMKKEEFQYQNITFLRSQSIIIKKIVQFMLNYSRKCLSSMKFWEDLQNFIKSNMLKNFCFKNIQQFLNHYAYDHSIITTNKIQYLVKQVIQSQQLLSNQQQFCKKERTSLNVSNIDNKNSSKLNDFLKNSQFNVVSIIDIKNSGFDKDINPSQNFSRILATTMVQDKNDQFRKQKQEEQFLKLSLKQKNVKKRKFSKSMIVKQSDNRLSVITNESQIQQRCQEIMDDQNIKGQKIKFKQNEALKKQKITSQILRENSQNLVHNNQFSIKFNKIDKNEDQIFHRKVKNSKKIIQITQKKDLINDKSVNQKSLQHSLRISNNSRSGSILKKGNTKSSQIKKHQDGLQASIKVQNQNKKHPTLVLPPEFQNSSEKIMIQTHENETPKLGFQAQNYFTSRTKNLTQLFKTFQNQPQTLKKTIKLEKNQNSKYLKQNQDLNLNQTIIKKQKNKNSKHQNIKPQRKIFQQIQNCKITSKNQSNIHKRTSSTSLNQNFQNGFEDKSKFVQNSLFTKKQFIDVKMNFDFQKKKNRISCNQIQKKDTMNKLSIKSPPYNSCLRTFKTITRLLSSQDMLQTSLGSFSQSDFSQGKQQKYSGILTKMGRSVELRKEGKDQQFKIQNQRVKRMTIDTMEPMPDFTKKKSIYQQGTNRSIKLF